MLKRCSNCHYCGMDWKALYLGIFIDKCFKKQHNVLHPFWKGWWCKDWRKNDG